MLRFNVFRLLTVDYSDRIAERAAAPEPQVELEMQPLATLTLVPRSRSTSVASTSTRSSLDSRRFFVDQRLHPEVKKKTEEHLKTQVLWKEFWRRRKMASKAQQQKIRRVVMTCAIAAVTAVGAWSGAWLKIEQQVEEVAQKQSEATAQETIAALEQQRGGLLAQRILLEKKIAEIEVRKKGGTREESTAGRGRVRRIATQQR